MTDPTAVFEEKKLIEDLQKSDPKAWERLWNEEAWRIIALARRRGLDKSSARDICMEVFEKLASRLQSPLSLEEGGLRLYIRKIAKYEIVKYLRERKGKVLLSTDDLADDSFLMDIIASPEAGPDEKFVQEERRIAIKEAIEKLNPQEQRLIMRYYLENQTASEIAQSLGLSANAARIWLHRIRKKLETNLAEALGK